MLDLAVTSKAADLPRDNGLTVARCNHSGTRLTVAQIRAMRAEPISELDFADAFTLVCERFDRNISDPLLRQFYASLGEHMGAEEFWAAYRDFWSTEMFFANVVPFFVKHVQKQRENGPDLISRGMSEVYEAGAEHGDL